MISSFQKLVQRIPNALAYVAWGLILGISLSLLFWMLTDGGFYLAIPNQLLTMGFIPLSPIAQSQLYVNHDIGFRREIFIGCCTGLAIATLFLLIRTLVGPFESRSIRSLLLLTGIGACWVSLCTQCESIVEFGRQSRLAHQSAHLRSFAAEVDQQWKGLCTNQNGLATLGPSIFFQSYPIQNPTICFFASPYTIDKSRISLVAIERSEGEAIRLQLAGANDGYWIECRWDDQWPHSFISGLNYPLTPNWIQPIGNQVFLVRYSQ